MILTLGLIGMLIHHLWTVVLTLYVFWVLKRVVLMVIYNSVL